MIFSLDNLPVQSYAANANYLLANLPTDPNEQPEPNAAQDFSTKLKATEQTSPGFTAEIFQFIENSGTVDTQWMHRLYEQLIETGLTVTDIVQYAAEQNPKFFHGADLINVDLSSVDFSGISLVGANFNWVDLADTNFSKADLTGAYFFGVDLTDVDFTDAKLHKTKFSLVRHDVITNTLQNAEIPQEQKARIMLEYGIHPQVINSMDDSIFEGANLREMNLDGINFHDLNLSGVDFSGSSLRGADLRGSDLDGASLNYADLDGANLYKASFFWTNLTAANLKNVILTGDSFPGNLAWMKPEEIRLNNVQDNRISIILEDPYIETDKKAKAMLERGIPGWVIKHIAPEILPNANLAGINLSGANLQNLDLSGTNLAGANLSNANLKWANLRNADLSGANLTGAILDGAKLSGAILTRIQHKQITDILQNPEIPATRKIKAMLEAHIQPKIIQSVMQSPALSNADLSSANLTWTDITGMDLSGATLKNADLRMIDMSQVNLSQANLTNAHLIEANLTEANLAGTNFFRANLRWGNFTNADISRADLRWANLDKANLSDANLGKANLFGANLSKANLNGADLSGAILSKANLSNADLTNATITGAILRNSILKDAILPARFRLDADDTAGEIHELRYDPPSFTLNMANKPVTAILSEIEQAKAALNQQLAWQDTEYSTNTDTADFSLPAIPNDMIQTNFTTQGVGNTQYIGGNPFTGADSMEWQQQAKKILNADPVNLEWNHEGIALSADAFEVEQPPGFPGRDFMLEQLLQDTFTFPNPEPTTAAEYHSGGFTTEKAGNTIFVTPNEPETKGIEVMSINSLQDIAKAVQQLTQQIASADSANAALIQLQTGLAQIKQDLQQYQATIVAKSGDPLATAAKVVYDAVLAKLQRSQDWANEPQRKTDMANLQQGALVLLGGLGAVLLSALDPRNWWEFMSGQGI